MQTDPKPLFDITDEFPTTIDVGDTKLPIKVKCFSRVEMEAFEKQWDSLLFPRGTAPLSDDEAAKLEAARLAFFEKSIRDAITLDEGLVRKRAKWITDGAGFIEVFHARKDVLSAAIVAIYKENKLGSVIRKNSNSPRVSEPGSEPSIPARGGEQQESTAASAEPSTTAAAAAVTAPSVPIAEGASV